MTGSTPAAPTQVLLQLPEDLATRLAQVVTPRRRNQFVIDVLRRELAKGDQALIDACDALNRIEAESTPLRAESAEWLDAPLPPASDALDASFDRAGIASGSAPARAPAAPAKKHAQPRR